MPQLHPKSFNLPSADNRAYGYVGNICLMTSKMKNTKLTLLPLSTFYHGLLTTDELLPATSHLPPTTSDLPSPTYYFLLATPCIPSARKSYLRMIMVA